MDGWYWRSGSWFRSSWPMARWHGSWVGHGGFILGIAIGGIAGYGIHPRSLVVIANTHFESICCRGAAVWYHRAVREFLQRDYAKRQPRRDTQPSPKS